MFGNFSRSPQEDYIATLQELRVVQAITNGLYLILIVTFSSGASIGLAPVERRLSG